MLGMGGRPRNKKKEEGCRCFRRPTWGFGGRPRNQRNQKKRFRRLTLALGETG